MKINPLSTYRNIPAGRRPEGARVSLRESAPEAKSDQVSFGSGAEIGRMAQSVLRESVRPEPAGRIAALRAAVTEGSYFVPSGRLADAILDRALGGM